MQQQLSNHVLCPYVTTLNVRNVFSIITGIALLAYLVGHAILFMYVCQ